jgi:hypothetical protein
MTRLVQLAAAIALLLTAAAPAALAHKPSDSYLRVAAADQPLVTVAWDIALRDLDQAIGLDTDEDGALTWGEVRTARERILAYALARLTLQSDAGPCPFAAGELLITSHSDGSYVVLQLAAACSAPPAAITVAYDLFAEMDPQHRGILRVESPTGVQTAILGPDRREATMTLADPGALSELRHYVEEGIWHIWIGFDHILFLLTLLLPAVLIRRDGGWHPERDFRAVFVRVLKIVTAFTVAHSITLSLAALGAVSLPSPLIESLIAASVVLSALNNIVPLVRERVWAVAFGFGLVHGFGFANVLLDLGLPKAHLALALFGFNVGVELGQLAIVAAFLPLAYLSRATWSYRRLALPAGSAAVAALACLWLVERLFDLPVAPV